MARFNVLFFDSDNSLCIRKDGEFQPLAIPGEVNCKWLVESIDDNGRDVREEKDFKAAVLFQSVAKKQCIRTQKILEELIGTYSGDAEGLIVALKRRAEEEKQILVESGNRGCAGKLKRVLRELQEEAEPVKKAKENKENVIVKSGGRKLITPKLSNACSQLQSQKLESLSLLAGMASVLQPAHIPSSEAAVSSPAQLNGTSIHCHKSPCHVPAPREFALQELHDIGLSSNSPLPAAKVLSDRFNLTSTTLSPRLLNSVSLLQNEGHFGLDQEVTPTRSHTPTHPFRVRCIKSLELGTSPQPSSVAPKISSTDMSTHQRNEPTCSTPQQNVIGPNYSKAADKVKDSHQFAVSQFDADEYALQPQGLFVCGSESPNASLMADLQQQDEALQFGNEETQPSHTGEMVYNSLSLVYENDSYLTDNQNASKEQILAENISLRKENHCLKERIQSMERNYNLVLNHMQAFQAAPTRTNSFPELQGNSEEMDTRSFTLQKADMQQLVKDANDPARFKDVLVPKREFHKLLEEARAARDGASFILNGVSELLFSQAEFASAKGVTKARAGSEVLNLEKVDAIHEFLKCVCKANNWPSMDCRVIRRKLATKICNARRGLKKTPPFETQKD